MNKEHLVNVSLTNGTECICNPEILLGTNSGLWDFENEKAPKGTLLDLNAAWELFLSRQSLPKISFSVNEHHLHEVIDGIIYEDGDVTYTLKDDKGNPTGATFTIKANKGPIEHIAWLEGKLYLYYTKLRPIEDSDIESGAPIYYVVDEEGHHVIDPKTGKELIYDYVAIPVMEIFDDDETRQLFPWFTDDHNTVRLRNNITGSQGVELGKIAITSKSEVFIAKEPDTPENVKLVSSQSLLTQLEKDLGITPTLVIDQDSPNKTTWKADGSNINTKLETTNVDQQGNKHITDAINEDYRRSVINTRLISAKELAGQIVLDPKNWQNILTFAQAIEREAFNPSTNPTIQEVSPNKNLLDALNWILEAEIGDFHQNKNSLIKHKVIDPSTGEIIEVSVKTVTEAINSIFSEAETNKNRIGWDQTNSQFISLNTDSNRNLTEAINEVDLHTDALSDSIGVYESYDPVNKETYYSNPDLNIITKNRLRKSSAIKDDTTIIEDINELLSQIGNLSSQASGLLSYELNTTNKENLVKAINEVKTYSDNNKEVLGANYEINQATGKKQGDITNLNTSDKTSVVNAINELAGTIGNLDELPTENKDSIVESLEELDSNIPFVYSNISTKKGIVSKELDDQSTAGEGSLVVGTGNSAGTNSFVIGEDNNVSGLGNRVSGNNNLVSGNNNNVSGGSHRINGNGNFVSGLGATINGNLNNISGQFISADTTFSTLHGTVIVAATKDGHPVNGVVALGSALHNYGNGSYNIGDHNEISENSVAIGSNNDSKNGIKNDSFGNDNTIKGDNNVIIGNENVSTNDDNYIFGTGANVSGERNLVLTHGPATIEGDGNIILSHAPTRVAVDNTIVIGNPNATELLSNTTNIAKEIYLETHDSYSNLQKLIFVNLNDWCKVNNSASLNGGKFLDPQHVVNAIKVFKTHNYSDNALLRFLMLTDENGYVLIQGKSTRIYLNGTWYFSDTNENGWSRREGEYLKVINKTVTDQSGRQVEKHYLAIMDLLSTSPVISTVGAQRSNTEDFSTINLNEAFGAVDVDDIETAMDLLNRFNSKVDKSARIITKYDDGTTTQDLTLNFINSQDPSSSANITLDLKTSFGFNKNDYQLKSEKGKANGYVPLNPNGKINSEYLPSYVDDIIDVWAEYLIDSHNVPINIKLFELTELKEKGTEILEGESGKIYIEAQPEGNNYLFRWSGSKFVPIGERTIIGEIEGTAFDGKRGKDLETAFNNHKNSGVTNVPVIDPNTGEQALDENNNPIWEVFNPNPHNVKAELLQVIVNDPNNPDNVDLDDPYYVTHTVDSAIKELYTRINSEEDLTNFITNAMGTPLDFEDLAKEESTIIRLLLNTPTELEINNLVNTYFDI